MPGKDGEAGDVGFIVDGAGCSQANNSGCLDPPVNKTVQEKEPLEARATFPTEPGSALDSNTCGEHEPFTLDETNKRDEMEKIVQRPLPPDLASWVERYEAVGERDAFLWKWCLKGVELTTLPCVDRKLYDFNNETKVLGVMFDVMLDDVADNTKDSRFLDQLMAIPFSHKEMNPGDLSTDKREYFQFTLALHKNLWIMHWLELPPVDSASVV